MQNVRTRVYILFRHSARENLFNGLSYEYRPAAWCLLTARRFTTVDDQGISFRTNLWPAFKGVSVSPLECKLAHRLRLDDVNPELAERWGRTR